MFPPVSNTPTPAPGAAQLPVLPSSDHVDRRCVYPSFGWPQMDVPPGYAAGLGRRCVRGRSPGHVGRFPHCAVANGRRYASNPRLGTVAQSSLTFHSLSSIALAYWRLCVRPDGSRLKNPIYRPLCRGVSFEWLALIWSSARSLPRNLSRRATSLEMNGRCARRSV
jgi:hypothetical protein